MDERQAWNGLRDELRLQFAGIARLASELQSPFVAGRIDHIWTDIQSLVISLGLVSSLLWPPEPRTTATDEVKARWMRWNARARRFRDEMGLSDESPLNVEKLRNHVAHVDERIHQWADALPSRNYAEPTAYMSEHHDGFESDWPRAPLRNFDRVSGKLFIYGDVFDLRGLVAEIARLERRLATILPPVDLWPDLPSAAPKSADQCPSP